MLVMKQISRAISAARSKGLFWSFASGLEQHPCPSAQAEVSAISDVARSLTVREGLLRHHPEGQRVAETAGLGSSK